MCVFCAIDMSEISKGEKLRSISVFLMKKHRSLLISTSVRFYSQRISNFEKHLELFSESNREAKSKNCKVLMTNTAPLPNFCCLGHSVKEHSKFHDLYPETDSTE